MGTSGSMHLRGRHNHDWVSQPGSLDGLDPLGEIHFFYFFSMNFGTILMILGFPIFRPPAIWGLLYHQSGHFPCHFPWGKW
jgi:hypothetical protein